MVKNFFKIIIIFFLLFYQSYSLSLNEAIELAKANYPKLKSEKENLLSTKFSYKSSFFNFIPTLSYNFNYTKYKDLNPQDYFARNHSLTVNWLIFNSGKNILNYRINKTNYLLQNENYKEELINLVYEVKKAYFIAASQKEILRYREIQLKSAELDYKLALEKFKLGLVKKSDVLNAKVRYENAKYTYIQSKSDFEIAIAELNSLIGYPLEKETKIDEKYLYIYCEEPLDSFNTLFNKMLETRPLIKGLKYQEKLAKLEVENNIYSFTPSISVFYQKNKYYSSLTGKDNYDMYGVKVDWILFDGLGRYYNYISAKHKENATIYKVKDNIRQLKLNLFRKYIEYKRNLEKVDLSREIIKQAEENYKQTLGEYKVGKNDIVALINSESNLADAQIKLVNSVLNLVLTKIEIEKEIGEIN